MRNVETSSFKTVVEHVKTFEYMDIGNGFAVARVKQITNVVDGGKLPKMFKSLDGQSHETTAYVCTIEQARKVAAGKLAHAANAFPEGVVYLAPQCLIDLIGSTWTTDETLIRMCQPLEAAGLWQQAQEDDVKIVRYDGRDNTWLDERGDALPQGMPFYYMRGNMDNANYDLVKVLEVLKQDPRIRFHDFDAKSYRPTKADEILPIPYYNVTEGRYSQLSFIYMPTVDDQAKINDWYRKWTMKNKYFSAGRYKAVEALDLLGINKFRIEEEMIDLKADDE